MAQQAKDIIEAAGRLRRNNDYDSWDLRPSQEEANVQKLLAKQKARDLSMQRRESSEKRRKLSNERRNKLIADQVIEETRERKRVAEADELDKQYNLYPQFNKTFDEIRAKRTQKKGNEYQTQKDLYKKIKNEVLVQPVGKTTSQKLRDARLKLKKYTLRRESSFPNKQWYKERYRSCLNKNNKPKEPSFTSVPSIEEQQYLSPPTVKHKTRKQRKNYDLELTPQKEPGRRVRKKRDFYKP